MAKALFLIPCCSRKNGGGEHPPWNVVKGNNSLSFLNPQRDELINLFIALPQDRATEFYKMRGSGDQRTKKVLKAWAKNRNIPQSRTMIAINRYHGNLYSAIDRDISKKLESNEIDNVLIASALLGIISPTDLIPDYELMMGDKSPNGKVAKFWSNAFQSDSVKPQLDELFSQYDYIYCLMSSTTGYLDSVIDILKGHETYYLVPNVSGQSNKSKAWGHVLTGCLRDNHSTPEEVGRVAEANGCEMFKLMKKGTKQTRPETPRPINTENTIYISKTEIGGRKLTATDEIRRYVWENIIEPAKRRGLKEITVRAGDVHGALVLSHRMPMVCNALKGMPKHYPVTLIHIDAPPGGQGANYYATYKI